MKFSPENRLHRWCLESLRDHRWGFSVGIRTVERGYLARAATSGDRERKGKIIWLFPSSCHSSSSGVSLMLKPEGKEPEEWFPEIESRAEQSRAGKSTNWQERGICNKVYNISIVWNNLFPHPSDTFCNTHAHSLAFSVHVHMSLYMHILDRSFGWMNEWMNKNE